MSASRNSLPSSGDFPKDDGSGGSHVERIDTVCHGDANRVVGAINHILCQSVVCGVEFPHQLIIQTVYIGIPDHGTCHIRGLSVNAQFRLSVEHGLCPFKVTAAARPHQFLSQGNCLGRRLQQRRLKLIR